MSTQRLIISTCGTSALTNLAGARRALVIKYANAVSAEDVPEEDRKQLQSVINEMQRRLADARPEELTNLSAELNGLFCLNKGRLDATHDTHRLIATDTWLGKSTAKAIGKVLERYGQNVEVKPIRDLRTDSLDAFHIAMTELARFCAEEVHGWRKGGWKIIFNLTGGFKGVQGFMQTLGMLYADETVYVFERTNEFLRIPRLPIRIDIADLFRGNSEEALKAFLRMAVKLPVKKKETHDLPESLLITIDDEVTLSAWGEIVWDNTRYEILGESLLPPITTRLRYAPGFKKTVKQYQQDKERMNKINERLMDLALYLEKQNNRNRLDFKKLQGKHDPWTHECDAWSDKDARRIFGHFEGDVFVVDDLQKALH